MQRDKSDVVDQMLIKFKLIKKQRFIFIVLNFSKVSQFCSKQIKCHNINWEVINKQKRSDRLQTQPSLLPI